MSVNLLCINSGSSSLKFALYQLAEAAETSLANGMIERIGLPGSRLQIRTAATALAVDEPGDVPDYATAVYEAFAALDKLRLPSPDAVGHRIVLGGLDTLVFTRGIGEHAAPVRWDVCRDLAYLGMQLDDQLNERHSMAISTPESRCIVRVVPTHEDLMVARHPRTLLFTPSEGGGRKR